MKTLQKLAALLMVLCLMSGLASCALNSEDIATAVQIAAEVADELESAGETDGSGPAVPAQAAEDAEVPDRDGSYTTKEDVALYLHTYGCLPSNFITKSEARALGWSGGGLDGYADGKCIGGDYFGNYEGILPDGSYHECDIDTLHASSRGAKRIIYSDDGRIYYTDDHYESFTLLYGEE